MSIKKVMVIGAGIMGSGIAQTCIEHGLTTVMVDISKEVAEKGAANINHFLERKIEKGKITREQKDAALKLLRRIFVIARSLQSLLRLLLSGIAMQMTALLKKNR